MYISPDSTIILIHNYPCASDYQHTYLFDNTSQQYTYFRALAKYVLPDNSYQRAGLGRLRVGILADNLYDVNYLMFQNSAYGNKWFYAFVTRITYINDGCTELEYTIDVMQTWRFDWEIRQSFIERQHSVTDAIGDSITPENVQPGEMVYNGSFANCFSQAENDYCLIIGVIDTAGQSVTLYRYDNAFSGAQLYAFDMSYDNGSTDLDTQLNAARDLITNYVTAGQPDAIAFMYMAPICCLPFGVVISTSATWTQHKIDTSAMTIEVSQPLPALTAAMYLDGYAPKNNKLFTYPYNMLIVTNGCGSSMTLRYELFDNLTPYISRVGTFTQPVNVLAKPSGYKGIIGADYMQSLTLSGYPSCSWSNDAYQAYIAQQSHNNMLWAGAGTLTNKIVEANIPYVSEAAKKVSALPSALASGGMNITNPLSILDGLQGLYSASNQVDLAHGSTQNAGPLYSRKDLTFKYTRASVRADRAKQIDDYFTRFGYAVNELGSPNLAARPYFTYVKTNAAFVCGGFDDATGGQIAQILDNGITFWRPGTTVADYSVNNTPA